MNKRQKQLINTYIRKREIANNMHGGDYELTPYEESYLVFNELQTKPLKDLRYREWAVLLTHYPQYINEFLKYVDLDIFDINKKFKILAYQPQFEELLNVNYDAYDYNYRIDNDLFNLLLKQPQFIDRIDERVVAKLEPYKRYQIILENPELYDVISLKGLPKSYHAYLIMEHPELIHRFIDIYDESELNKLGKHNIGDILLTHPELYKFFNEQTIDELDENVKAHIAKHSTEFTKKYIHNIRDAYHLKDIVINYPHMYYLLNNLQRSVIRTYHHQIILKRPELIKKLEDIAPYTIVEVLLQNENLIDEFDYSTFKKPYEFGYLFKEIPAAINNPTVNKYITPETHLEILNDFPEIIDDISFKYIIKKTFNVDGLVKFNNNVMSKLVDRKPDFENLLHKRNQIWWNKNKQKKDE